jgi:branched-chain amino acid transport system substrate-binding protein
MLEAIVKGAAGGPADPAKTRQALRALDTQSVLGRVAFDEKGDPKYFSAVLFQTINGKQVVVYPRERSQGKATYPAVPWNPPSGK